MSLLDRYIFRELIVPFVAGILAFTFILSGSTILFQLISEAIKYGIPFTHFIQLFIFKLPAIIALSFPMSMLLATLLTFGRMGNDLEVLALRAGGVSIVRMVVPVIAFGIFVSMMTVWFNESVVPRASRSAEDLFRSYRDKEAPNIKENINITEYKDRLPSRIINVAEVDNGVLKHVTVAEYEEGKLVRVIQSDTGKWLSEGGWQFNDGVMHNFEPTNRKKVTVIEFKKEFVNIKINPLDLSKRKRSAEEMTRSELKQAIAFKVATGVDPIKDIMDYHMKFSIAFASLIYSILGASIGLRPHRSSSGLGLGLSLLIIFIYIVLLSLGTGLGLSHILPPLFAAWIPNIVAGAAGLTLLRKVASQ